jgi:parvulin-like peptidyl-prolyl isomerase
VSVRHLPARTEEESWHLKDLLEHGATFESLAGKLFHDPRLAQNGGYLGFIGWGEMDPAFEDAAYSLPVGVISTPVRTAQGFSIMRVEKKWTVPLSSQQDYLSARKKILMTLRANKIVDEGMNFGSAVLANLHVQIDDRILHQLFDCWNDILATPNLESPPLSGLSHEREHRILLSCKLGQWTVSDFLRKLKFTSQRQRSRIRSVNDLRECIYGLVTRAELVDRAKSLGYLEDEEVLSQINGRVNYYLYSRWHDEAVDSVTYREHPSISASNEQEKKSETVRLLQEHRMKAYFEKSGERFRFPDEVRISEIFVYSKLDAVDLLKRLTEGGNFRELALKYSKREWGRLKAGDLGYHTQEEYGILGPKIFSSLKGDIIGPAPIDSGYSIVQVVDKRAGRAKTFGEAREDILSRLEPRWQNIAFFNALSRLQRLAKLEINEERLQRLPWNDPVSLAMATTP